MLRSFGASAEEEEPAKMSTRILRGIAIAYVESERTVKRTLQCMGLRK